ncbi:dihydroorotase [Kamptonema formosum]|uniref:dihydroorotase n=1 Tax=Kamptonema formosum TaxID=331992 RepID=UPI000477F574|nr:dihydroorotase [Oscillatoria sp. PCC 10802]
MNSELLQQVRVLDPLTGTDRIADVLIAGGIIKEIAPEIPHPPADTQVRDCRGLVLGPGLADLYSHSGEPGFEERETLESLIRAAAAGGFTRVAILPDTTPPADSPAVLALFRSRVAALRAGEKGPNLNSKIDFWGALTVGVKGQQMAELAELAAAGAAGFADGLPVQNLALLRRLLEYLQPLGLPVALWPSHRELASTGVMREGPDSIRFGLPGNPAISETAALAALLEVIEATGTCVHVMRVSTAGGVRLIEQAKERGLPVSASTTWLHLLLDTQALVSYNTSLRLSPPLGNPEDREALRRGVRLGAIDAVAIDHTPHTYEEKTVAFGEAPPGAIGLELALPLLWGGLVETGEWTALELWRVLSTGPASCLKQKPASLAAGESAEITLFDPQLSWKVGAETLQTRSANTSWLGHQLTGRVVQTWLSQP